MTIYYKTQTVNTVLNFVGHKNLKAVGNEHQVLLFRQDNNLLQSCCAK